jgi:hypothetical protein
MYTIYVSSFVVLRVVLFYYLSRSKILVTIEISNEFQYQ